MYRRVNWVVIELQARWVAAIFSNRLPIPSAAIQEMRLDVQRRIRAQISRPQFPHSDYFGIINDFN